jgi:hypothetical protein
MDIFKPTDAPKDVAISSAIDKAVEALISDDMVVTRHYFEMAEEFIRTPSEHFNPTSKETHAV